eukprot:CAMPEP_0116559048 /NCGR_PEP_ID=MMETSP0397-20121206/10166_1 /TAXON_ID=216820 /ORGANISM="Cyclophora tenuis, Strain ECT3854" /LENGTH=269 /DNA_ID=CAMNT_0004084747 /DNA_START=167 /DNA_END=976 /DNA_ORIENTATION=-
MHPENATVSIDPRFYIPGNPWLTVYEEVKSGLLPVAVAYPIQVQDGQEQLKHQPQELEPAASSNDETSASSSSIKSSESPTSVFSGGTIVDKIVGVCFVITTVSLTVGLEIACLVLYFLALLFAQMVNCLGHPNIITALPIGVLMLAWQVCASVDLVLLLVSIFVVELLGLICAFLCCVAFGGCAMGRAWHQAIRRLSHLVRWACRSVFERFTPSRSNPFILPRLRSRGSASASASAGAENQKPDQSSPADENPNLCNVCQDVESNPVH